MDTPSMRAGSELRERRTRITTFLDDHGLDALWLGRPTNFAWLTGGSNVVDRASPVGVAAAGYSRDEGFRVLTNTIEAERLRDEELPKACTVTETDWYTDSLAEFVASESPAAAAADFDVPGCSRPDLSELRQPLASFDVDRYRELGRETATAVESVCRGLTPSRTEQDVAVEVRTALESRGIEAPVVLVGGGERATQYRHYTPTTATLGAYALVSVTAQRGGLHASATRTVAFESAIDDAELAELRERDDVGGNGEPVEDAKSRITAGDVFAAIQDAYEAVGYPDEWQRHHQGGAAGFAGREWFGRPDAEDPVTAPMAYAWNPTVQGAKSEDTVLVGGEGGEGGEEFEVLTATGRWPTTAVEARGHDATTERPDVLVLGSGEE